MSKAGAIPAVSIADAAAARSAILELKLVSPNEPPLWPRPVKSKRRTPKPFAVSARAMRTAAIEFLVHVKQWANKA